MLAVDDFLGPAGRLARQVKGFAYRPQQAEMARAVSETLEQGGVLICEAGTGTGKTFAYLVPALLSGRKVVISTGTRNLQEDLPITGKNVDPNAIFVGKNSSGNTRYDGPCPPSGTHRYYFKLYALDTTLGLLPGATKEQVLKEMQGHILAQGELMGTFSK